MREQIAEPSTLPTPDAVPASWLNFLTLLPPLPPPCNAHGSSALEVLSRIRLRAVLEQDTSTDTAIPIPRPVQQLYAQVGRPTPLVRADALEKHLRTRGRIYLKREDMLPTGSFKLNSAIAQAYFAAQEGVKTLVTETGAGQWGHAVAYAARLFDLNTIIFWAGVSARQKPGRHALLRMLGATVYESPSRHTAVGRDVLSSGRHGSGSLGSAIGEAISYAEHHPTVRYISGSNVPHVLMHQTVIGQETQAQLAARGDDADVLIAAVGGGSNLIGLIAPYLAIRADRGTRPLFIGAESAAAPRLTQGTWRYDHADPFGITPLSKSYTLGLDYELPETHVGGLRQHSGSTAVGVLRREGLLDAVAYTEREAFETGRLVAHTEGFLPAPESAHALRAAIERASNLNRDEAMVVCVSGSGLLDIDGYIENLDQRIEGEDSSC
jgi:pyridoxal-phosphate dependent TrpB-like enzyme